MSNSSPTIDALGRRFWSRWIASQSSIATRLAWRNITRDRIRFVIAIIGVGFAVLLMTVQLGLLIGFALTSSSIIDHAQADIWIVPRGTKNVDQPGQMDERQKYLALEVPGVALVQSLVLRFTYWQRPDGGTESALIVGIDRVDPALQPWNVISGSVDDLRISDGLIIDELYAGKLGVTHVGQTVEVGNHHSRVVGMTSQIRTFTQSPYAFTTLKNAKMLTGLPDDHTTYLLVRGQSGTNIAELRTALQKALPFTDVWTSSEFSWQTRLYWMLTTGAGTALLLTAILGVVVGSVIVSQTLYSATVERMEEFGTIRAMGGSDRYLLLIVLRQALLSGVAGYTLGAVGANIVAWFGHNGSASMSISPILLLVLAVTTLGMCVAACLISIRKVLTVDVASVFR